eukprot:11586937-Ditylum_brightwellii.AAC.1
MEAIQSFLGALVHINCNTHLKGALALSLASEALSEILIRKIALKNCDRIGLLQTYDWTVHHEKMSPLTLGIRDNAQVTV